MHDYRNRMLVLGLGTLAVVSSSCSGAKPSAQAGTPALTAGFGCVVPASRQADDHVVCTRLECARRCNAERNGAACVALAKFDSDVLVEVEPGVFQRRVDPIRSLELYDRACTFGHALGCLNAARLVAEKEGHEANAASRLDRGCRLGNMASCEAMADGLMEGRWHLGAAAESRRCALDLVAGLCRARVSGGCWRAAQHEPDQTHRIHLLRQDCDPESTGLHLNACNDLIEALLMVGKKADARALLEHLCAQVGLRGDSCSRACGLGSTQTCPRGPERLDRD